MEITPGKESSEFRIVLLNYVVGLILISGGLFLEYKGRDSSTIMAMGVSFLGLNGIGYGVLRTTVKSKSINAKMQVQTASMKNPVSSETTQVTS